MEKIVQTKTCRHCQTSFPITDKDVEFYEKISPVFTGKKYSIPAPTFCPDCRQQRRLSWQNMYKLYYVKCALSNESMISMYSPDKPYIIYSQQKWWSSEWDPIDYGRDFDFSRNFFGQFHELNLQTPHVNLNTDFTIDQNSLFCNYAWQQKNCYLMFHSSLNEDCFFGTGIKESKDCVDVLDCFYSERLYGCMDCLHCHNLKFCRDCQDCSNSFFLEDCIGCEFCIGCKNLVGKKCYIFNKPASKERYDQIMAELAKGSGQIYDVRKYIQKLFLNMPHRGFHGNKNENVSWDNITNSKNISESFDIQESEDMKFCERIYNGPNKNCYDLDQFWLRSEKVYEGSEIGFDANTVLFSVSCRNTVHNLFYCFETIASSHCFGCIGLRNKSYCILNKQYTREEYEVLVPKIIEHMQKTGEWGEFFPSSLSPFWYNETVAQEYYPLDRRDVSQKHLYPDGTQIFNWSDYEKQNGYEGVFYEPLNTSEYDSTVVGEEQANVNKEALLKGILKCEVSGKPYRIISQELDFYIKHNLPIPRRHPDQRHLDRMALRNPRKLFERKCDKCEKEMITTYAPERPERVYCETCYEKEVIG